MKKVLTIQDISCFGKCSLTVALPLISAMGVETVILPTAVLSTHTLFKGFTCKDLSDQILPITQHWASQNIAFDAVYTGYLGTEEEIETVKDVIASLRASAAEGSAGGDAASDRASGEDAIISGSRTPLVFIDPAMGDNGKLYPAFNEAYAKRNASLCAVADVIVPNITEACFMTDTPYLESYDECYVRNLLEKLAGLGAKTAVLTGVSLSEGKTGVMGYDTQSGRYFSYQNDRIPAAYHGTGDIFSSVTVGALMNGLTWEKAFQVAADYTALTIDVTRQNPEKPWYGVDFEQTIPELIRMLQAAKA